MALDMAKFVARFVEEAREHVHRLNGGLISLENKPEDAETINSVFRSAHTIKGSSRMMKFIPISEVAHKLEDALGALRDRKIKHSKPLSDVLFRGIDCIAGMVEKVAAGQDPATDTTVLCEELTKAAEGIFDAAQAVPESAKDESGASAPPREPEQQAAGVQSKGTIRQSPSGAQSAAVPASAQEARAKGADTIRISAERLDELIRLMGEMVSQQNRLKHRLADVGQALKEAKKIAYEDGKRQMQTVDSNSGIAATAGSLRARLERLASNIRDDSALQELLTSELVEKSLTMRMLPLSIVFDSFPRMVRDLSRSLQKEIDLVIEGAEIGLDKNMIERIGDPLVHMIRNAVDHGIESPEKRRAAGKPERGTIKLSATYDAGSVLIEVGDDGAGISVDRLREKALQKKIVREEDLKTMSEAEALALIFEPGFSTSAMITDLSGRGVGMDVVRKDIVDELKGSIEIRTREEQGTSFLIRIPMTLSVMRALLIGASGRTFAVVAHYVNEVIRVSPSEIILVLEKKAIRLRNEIIPVVPLSGLLGLPVSGSRSSEALLVLIARVGNEKIGLIIDSLIDEQDMVIKSLPAHLKNLPLVSGAALSGDNEIISILHVPGLIKQAAETREPVRTLQPETPTSARILVVDDSVNTREIEKSILEAYGYIVDIAGDGLEAVERSRTISYDLVITDVEMPRLDGFSLTERLRKEETYRETPIIIVTSLEKEEDRKRGALVGANAYIVKGGFDQTNLIETVQNLIG